jgi:hypothetical protein
MIVKINQDYSSALQGESWQSGDKRSRRDYRNILVLSVAARVKKDNPKADRTENDFELGSYRLDCKIEEEPL